MSSSIERQNKQTGNQNDDGTSKGHEQDYEETPPRGTKRGRFEASPTLALSLTEAEGVTEVEQAKPVNVSVISYLWDDDEKRSVESPGEGRFTNNPERKRDSINPERKMRERAANLIRGIDKEMREMRKLITENQNTKKEIKQLVSRLSSLVSQLSTKNVLDSLEETYDPREVIIINETKEQASQTQVEDKDELEDCDAPTKGELSDRLTRALAENRRFREQNAHLTNEIQRLRDHGEVNREPRTSVATQTESSAWQIRNASMISSIRAKIVAKRGFEGWSEVSLQDWPREVYAVVKELKGNPIWENNEHNLVFLTARGDKLDKGIGRQLSRRFPEVENLPEDSGLASLLLETKIASSGGDINTRKTLTRVWMENEDMTTYMNLLSLKQKVEEWGLNRIALPIPEENWGRAKKMLEHIFCGTGISVMAYDSRREAKKRARATVSYKRDEGSRRPPKKRRNYDAVVVKAKGKTFADLLKGVKEKVDVSKLGINITGARSTKEGNLLLTMEKGEGTVRTLKEEISKCLEGDQVEVREGGEKPSILHIKGLEATATAMDVKAAIKTATGNLEGNVEVKSMRPAFADRQNATVEVESKAAENLLALGRLRVGWSICTVQKRVGIARCVKCWGVNHRTRECTGVDRTALCLKCAQEGHRVRECQNEPFCPICTKRGHRADSMTCPIYREAVRVIERTARRRQDDSEDDRRRGNIPTYEEEEQALRVIRDRNPTPQEAYPPATNDID